MCRFQVKNHDLVRFGAEPGMAPELLLVVPESRTTAGFDGSQLMEGRSRDVVFGAAPTGLKRYQRQRDPDSTRQFRR
jgi:hypothetical protein